MEAKGGEKVKPTLGVKASLVKQNSRCRFNPLRLFLYLIVNYLNDVFFLYFCFCLFLFHRLLLSHRALVMPVQRRVVCLKMALFLNL